MSNKHSDGIFEKSYSSEGADLVGKAPLYYFLREHRFLYLSTDKRPRSGAYEEELFVLAGNSEYRGSGIVGRGADKRNIVIDFHLVKYLSFDVSDYFSVLTDFLEEPRVNSQCFALLTGNAHASDIEKLCGGKLRRLVFHNSGHKISKNVRNHQKFFCLGRDGRHFFLNSLQHIN